ncbi:HsdM family class I SAM-dependent methyltransferase [Deinococcus xianganensis]|uniref:site-specific DNA-methyltransferase (adenine-specific) n=1 Tax=Deinococcus xianganensis TaxID=1507289 RepID=A0A6I4YEL5_9DEIO|nr:N-6 DNA methylase [Deinococcus xianganensis]MXV19982.1 N-6 DNA methylase [Deinococcus xianganensis]
MTRAGMLFDFDRPEIYLNKVYSELDLESGMLLSAVERPKATSKESENWLNVGEWLELAYRAGAEKIFFHNNDPVIVFCSLDVSDEKLIAEMYRKIWCMTRPMSVFIALPGELRVYALNKTPSRDMQEWRKVKPIKMVRNIADISNILSEFHRQRVESGLLYEDKLFGNIGQRADERLLLDLKSTRKRLLDAGLQVQQANNLITKAIFIRYLEDRKILSNAYYTLLAEKNPIWKSILNRPDEKADALYTSDSRKFHKILKSRDFTIALLHELSRDFRGDIFLDDAEEWLKIDSNHLDILRKFLLGESSVRGEGLFFWAYDFEIIPIGLISSIYEDFYHSSIKESNIQDNRGTHYTPAFLVDYILINTLTPDILKKKPRIIDPACGSGIFLVESFRRIVRFEVAASGRRLPHYRLRRILKDQITGIEINPEAAKVTTFSLYLALLHYQEPREIRKSPSLPGLIYREHQNADDYDEYGIIINSDAFSSDMIKTISSDSHRGLSLDFLNGQFDLVIGNPPWEEAKSDSLAMRWARKFDFPIGDNNLSQLFIHRAMKLCREGGIVSLLVHSNVLFNQRRGSIDFRRFLLENATITKCINFIHIRKKIFPNATAPFVLIEFSLNSNEISNTIFPYISIRNVNSLSQKNLFTLSSSDVKLVSQAALRENDYLWKTYWWGGKRDAALMGRLSLEQTLDSLLGDDGRIGFGFQRGKEKLRPALKNLSVIDPKKFRSFGRIDEDWFEELPDGAKRQPEEKIYYGQRLIVSRGVKKTGLTVRLENEPYAFRHTMLGISLNEMRPEHAKTIVGIFWSKLGQYRTFMKAGSWGNWHDSFVTSDIMTMPIRLPEPNSRLESEIVHIVDHIRDLDISSETLINTSDSDMLYLSANDWLRSIEEVENHNNSVKKLYKLRRELDNAVYELFELNEGEITLIEDFFNYKLDLLNNGAKSKSIDPIDIDLSIRQGTIDELSKPEANSLPLGLHSYLYYFVRAWNSELEPEGHLSWQIIFSKSQQTLAIIFSTLSHDEKLEDINSEIDRMGYDHLIDRVDGAMKDKISHSFEFDRIVRYVSDTDLVIVKRNQARLWTGSVAFEDIEATLLKAIALQELASESSNTLEENDEWVN